MVLADTEKNSPSRWKKLTESSLIVKIRQKNLKSRNENERLHTGVILKELRLKQLWKYGIVKCDVANKNISHLKHEVLQSSIEYQ